MNEANTRAAASHPSQAGRTFGVELALGRIDADSNPAVIEQIRGAVARHGFVVLRDQRFVDSALLALGRCFGTIEERVIKYSTMGPLAARDASLWHHHSHCHGALEDWILYYTPAVPQDGGELELFDATQCFAQLDESDRVWARQQRVRHDFTHVAHSGVEPVAEPAWHPLVARRVIDGEVREALYLGAHAMELTDGTCLTQAAAGTPLARIQEQARNQALCHVLQARPHDLVVWDLKMVAHRSHSWASSSLRVIHEVMVKSVPERMPTTAGKRW
jgi:alpha-ketoglutarate-dependent taurine dioxygenase